MVPPGAPFEGTMLVEGNTIQGFAGNGVLIETPYRDAGSVPAAPTISLRGNDVSGNGHWGLWIAGSGGG